MEESRVDGISKHIINEQVPSSGVLHRNGSDEGKQATPIASSLSKKGLLLSKAAASLLDSARYCPFRKAKGLVRILSCRDRNRLVAR